MKPEPFYVFTFDHHYPLGIIGTIILLQACPATDTGSYCIAFGIVIFAMIVGPVVATVVLSLMSNSVVTGIECPFSITVGITSCDTIIIARRAITLRFRFQCVEWIIRPIGTPG